MFHSSSSSPSQLVASSSWHTPESSPSPVRSPETPRWRSPADSEAMAVSRSRSSTASSEWALHTPRVAMTEWGCSGGGSVSVSTLGTTANEYLDDADFDVLPDGSPTLPPAGLPNVVDPLELPPFSHGNVSNGHGRRGFGVGVGVRGDNTGTERDSSLSNALFHTLDTMSTRPLHITKRNAAWTDPFIADSRPLLPTHRRQTSSGSSREHSISHWTSQLISRDHPVSKHNRRASGSTFSSSTTVRAAPSPPPLPPLPPRGRPGVAPVPLRTSSLNPPPPTTVAPYSADLTPAHTRVSPRTLTRSPPLLSTPLEEWDTSERYTRYPPRLSRPRSAPDLPRSPLNLTHKQIQVQIQAQMLPTPSQTFTQLPPPLTYRTHRRRLSLDPVKSAFAALTSGRRNAPHAHSNSLSSSLTNSFSPPKRALPHPLTLSELLPPLPTLPPLLLDHQIDEFGFPYSPAPAPAKPLCFPPLPPTPPNQLAPRRPSLNTRLTHTIDEEPSPRRRLSYRAQNPFRFPLHTFDEQSSTMSSMVPPPIPPRLPYRLVPRRPSHREDPLAETVTAIRAAEAWEWPIPPAPASAAGRVRGGLPSFHLNLTQVASAHAPRILQPGFEFIPPTNPRGSTRTATSYTYTATDDTGHAKHYKYSFDSTASGSFMDPPTPEEDVEDPFVRTPQPPKRTPEYDETPRAWVRGRYSDTPGLAL